MDTPDNVSQKNTNTSKTIVQTSNIPILESNIHVHHQLSDKTKIKENEKILWEMWMRSPNTTPASTVLSSPDLSEIEPTRSYQNQIKVGRSPVDEHRENDSPILIQHTRNDLTNFNDEEFWQHKKTLDHSLAELNSYGFNQSETSLYENLNDLENSSSNITKMIGVLPINDYDGSPRRFGNIHHDEHLLNQTSKNVMCSPSLYHLTPRPGFPQRVVIPPQQRQSTLPKPSNKGISKTSNDVFSTQLPPNSTKDSSFNYLYEFSETRKVLEEFFNFPNDNIEICQLKESGIKSVTIDALPEHLYVGQRLANLPKEEYSSIESLRPSGLCNNSENEVYDNNKIELYLDSASRSSGELADTELENNARRNSRNYTISPETTDYDSNCGDLESISNDINGANIDFVQLYTSMPVLEDGLSSGHASDTENNNPITNIIERKISDLMINTKLVNSQIKSVPGIAQRTESSWVNHKITVPTTSSIIVDTIRQNNIDNSYNSSLESKSVETCKIFTKPEYELTNYSGGQPPTQQKRSNKSVVNLDITNQSINGTCEKQSAIPHNINNKFEDAHSLYNEKLIHIDENLKQIITSDSQIWIHQKENSNSQESLVSEIPLRLISCDEEEADTDLETDRLLGQQRLDDLGYYDDKNWSERKVLTTQLIRSPNDYSNSQSQIKFTNSAALVADNDGNVAVDATTSNFNESKLCNLNENTESRDNLERSPIGSTTNNTLSQSLNNGKSKNKEGIHAPEVLIEGVLFRARYLGSTQLVCEGQPTKSTRMMQAEEAVSRIKAPEGESQPSTEVDLFISTEKIMVLNTDLKEIMMDHALRTISYIADIGDLVVLMARRRFVPSETDDGGTKLNRTPKMICHVFESEEAQFIAQSIGQAFQVAYMEFLKANGIEDNSFVKEMDYQEVLNSQEIFGDELEIFAKKELQKEVVVPKAKGEILGVVIVESGWGSMLPTVVIANLLSSGSAARCGQLNIGDQIIAINGLSLVGLPLSTCQNYIRNTKNQTAVKFTVVPCPPVVEVKIKRPNTKYQLGFSVQNGVICSLLRGGIAERGGVRVGHRIIEINNQSVVAVPHEKIVNLLATSVGEISMKTMPTSMFRLLTGQENPAYI